MLGTTISHYTILEKLGEGGMGVVYKARDLTLDRVVALKFLPPRLVTDEAESSRLLQEARAASVLNHPGISTIHAIGEYEGGRFIDLEFIDGRTLGEILRQGRLPVRRALGYAVQICEALQEAHANDIVHRDIKADNIMVTSRDRIKVMDFGLARLKGSMKITRAHSTIGTLACMAPEQVQGEEADARSDIFSFGVLLYEMLAGRLPFRGDHEAAVLYSILHGTPEPLSQICPEVSEHLAQTVSRALAKDPASRYQSVVEMAADLKKEIAAREREDPAQTPAAQPGVRQEHAGRLTLFRMRRVFAFVLAVVLIGAAWFWYRGGLRSGAVAPGGRRMLVVLPFENLGAAEREYFADGITEEITSKLSGLSGLGVIARTSAMQYKKSPKSIRQIGDELGVQFILQGTVRWEDDGAASHVRVTPQLINVADGTQIWSRSTEAVMAGVFTIQSEIATKVADALNVTLLQPERQVLESRLTESPGAYDSYLRGREFQHRSHEERDMLAAEQQYRKAVALDPKFALAYARLSGVQSALYWEYYDHSEERVRKTKEAAEKALALDPDLPDAHGALAFYYYHCLRDYENARREFDRGLAAQPGNADLRLGLGAVDRRMGRWDDALANMEQSVQSDPRAAVPNFEIAETYIPMRKYDGGEKYLDRALEIAPQWSAANCAKAELYLLRDGDPSKARQVFDDARMRKIDGTDPRYVYIEVAADECGGRFQDALDILSGLGPSLFSSQEQYIPRDLFEARLFGFMGRAQDAKSHYDAARTSLEKEVRTHSDDPRVHSALGIAYAGLGRKEFAMREGKVATTLLPVSRDALIGPLFVRDMAEILVMVGERQAAIEQLEYLLSIPSAISIQLLRIDPAWDPLLNEPAFRKLVAAGQSGN